MLWRGGGSLKVQLTVTVFVLGAWLIGALALHDRVIRPIQTLANLLGALREGDYGIRARGANPDDALGLVYHEINALTHTLHERRLDSIEAGALLRRVMQEIDTAIFAVDRQHRLRLVNRAGAELLGDAPERLLGRRAGEVGLATALRGPTPRVVDVGFPGRTGRWEVRRSTFRQGGRPLTLFVLSDVSAVLREEERLAWRRLIRVLSHEINNSLAPIKSIAESLDQSLERTGDEAPGDLRSGLQVIAARSEGLRRFMASYAKLARLPEPRRTAIDLRTLTERVVGLESRRAVQLAPGPDAAIDADPDQLEQLLINVVANAVEALDDEAGGVSLTWKVLPEWVELHVVDNGPGLPDPANLFVPFFTTKPNGTGIGLTLSRQIAEAHGGTLSVENRRDARGCVARIRLPRRPIQARAGNG